jgi:hypothetical protein
MTEVQSDLRQALRRLERVERENRNRKRYRGASVALARALKVRPSKLLETIT